MAAVQGTNARGGVGGGTKTAVRDFLPELRGVGGGGGGGNGGNKFQALALVARYLSKGKLERKGRHDHLWCWAMTAKSAFQLSTKYSRRKG